MYTMIAQTEQGGTYCIMEQPMHECIERLKTKIDAVVRIVGARIKKPLENR